jgi:ATP-dependent Zn protease
LTVKSIMDLPDVREREEIFEVHLGPIKVVKVRPEVLARQTPGFSGLTLQMFVMRLH